MKELTLKKKIIIIDNIIDNLENSNSERGICSLFSVEINSSNNEHKKEIYHMFPELYVMINKIGRSLNNGSFDFSSYWKIPIENNKTDDDIFNYRIKVNKFRSDFRIEKLRELKNKLK